MTETRRKTHTSTEVKRRYNAKVYTQISASVPKEMAAAFKERCLERGVPQAQVIKAARGCGRLPARITPPWLPTS